MKWIEIILEAETDITEEASNAFMEMGATGTQIQNPDEIRSLIEQAGASELADVGDFYNEMQKYRITAYFPPSKKINTLKGALKQKFPIAEIFTREVDDSNWKNNWKVSSVWFHLSRNIFL